MYVIPEAVPVNPVKVAEKSVEELAAIGTVTAASEEAVITKVKGPVPLSAAVTTNEPLSDSSQVSFETVSGSILIEGSTGGSNSLVIVLLHIVTTSVIVNVNEVAVAVGLAKLRLVKVAVVVVLFVGAIAVANGVPSIAVSS